MYVCIQALVQGHVMYMYMHRYRCASMCMYMYVQFMHTVDLHVSCSVECTEL